MNELEYNNFFYDPVTYYKNDKEVKSGEHYLSDFKLTSDQDVLCQLLSELNAAIIPFTIYEGNGIITSIEFKIVDNSKHYVTFYFNDEGKLKSNIEKELRLGEVKLTKKWKDSYASKGFTLMTRSEVLHIYE
ncbi:hypothetical protein [Spiroplasma sp. DGKH1]|uniref:hypothetical protein n=1 Tax=Spiroplasma sp. DGKH1 TaxID=3050074 RepID=UPI0034C6AD47